MKTIFIEKESTGDIYIVDRNHNEEFMRLVSEYKILESPVVYFSAGDSKIKEILVKKDPSFSG